MDSTSTVGQAAKPGHIQFSPWLAVIAILFACIVANFRCLHCFFFADDFLCLDYLYKIFHGHPEILMLRLLAPWQDPSISLLYRPICDVLFALDYLLYNANAVGYHFTNLLLHCACSLLVFLCVQRACHLFDHDYASTAAVLSALVFATHPLHVEPVVWIVGRADLAATAFLLGSLFFAMRSFKNSRSIDALSLLLFAGALLSKEASACAPAIILGYLLLLSDEWIGLSSICRRLAPYLILIGIYMIIRFFVLGTPLGGYAGSLGEALTSDWLYRVTDWNQYAIVGLGANLAVFKPDSIEIQLLHMSFLMMAALLLARIPLSPWDSKALRTMAFFGFALVSSLLPALQVVGVTGALSNERVFYLATAFLIPLAVIAVVPASAAESRRLELLKNIARAQFFLFSVLYAWMSFESYTPWVEGSRIVLKLQSAVNAALASLEPGRKLVVVNQYANLNGAHLIYEFKELASLAGPNFNQCDRSQKLLALDEYPDFVSASTQRLQRLLADRKKYAVMIFDPKGSFLIPVIPTNYNPYLPISYGAPNPIESASTVKSSLRQTASLDEQDVAYIAQFPVASQIDDNAIIESEISWAHGGSRQSRFCFSQSNTSPHESDMAQGVRSLVPGSFKYYISTFELRRAVGSLPSCFLFSQLPDYAYLHSINMIPAAWSARLQPDMSTVTELPNGNYVPAHGGIIELDLDVSKVPGACAMSIERAAPNFLFVFGKANVRSPAPDAHVDRVHRIDSTAEKLKLNTSDLKPGCRYSYRLIALDRNNNPIGFYSDTVSIDLRKPFF